MVPCSRLSWLVSFWVHVNSISYHIVALTTWQLTKKQRQFILTNNQTEADCDIWPNNQTEADCDIWPVKSCLMKLGHYKLCTIYLSATAKMANCEMDSTYHSTNLESIKILDGVMTPWAWQYVLRYLFYHLGIKSEVPNYTLLQT